MNWTEQLYAPVKPIGSRKTICLSLIGHKPLSIEDILAEVSTIIVQTSEKIAFKPAKRALNIYPRNINKSSGLLWLSEKTGIAVNDMAGVGDTSGDVAFLKMTGFSAAPGNSIDEVKSAVQWVSDRHDSEGLNDILDYWELP